MATSNDPAEVNDDLNSAHRMESTSVDTEELLNNLLQRGDLLQEQPNVYNISAGASRPGTVDSDTLELMLDQANETFVPTRTFKDIRRLLEKNCHVTICGASGEGKTTMALKLAEKYRKQGYELVFVNRPDVFDLGSCISSGQKFCLIFDDLFGSLGRATDYSYVRTLCHSLKMRIEHNLRRKQNDKVHTTDQSQQGLGQMSGMSEVGSHKAKPSQTKELRVIFTAKTYNFKDGVSKMQYQRLSVFNAKMVVDLTLDPDRSYSQEEKKRMFQKHRESFPQSKLGKFTVEDVLNQDSALFGFPLTCRLFFEFPTFTEKADDFFKRPLYYLRIELNDILSRRNDQSAALILVLLCEENIKLPELESPTINEKVDEMVFKVTNFANSGTRSGIAAAARMFRGTFLSRGDNLSFAHSSIYEACACALYQFNPSFVLKYCSLDFLYEHLKPGHVDESGVSDQLHYLFVSEEYYHLVVTRLISSMKQGIFSKTVAHPMNRSEGFVEKFLEKLKTFAYEDKNWIQIKEQGKGFLYWVVRSKSKTLVQTIETMLQIKFTQEDIREAMFASVECDSLTLLKILIEKFEGDLNQTDRNSLLIIGAENGGKEIVKCLLNMGADISCVDDKKRNFLHLLCINDRPNLLETVKTFSDINKDLTLAMNALDVDGRTPMMLAAFNGTWDCFQQMTNEVQADMDGRGDRLIHLACKGGNKNIVECVLTNDNINTRGRTERTPIMVAAAYAKSKIFDLLMSRSASTTLLDKYGYTLLHLACRGGNKDIVERLLTDVNINSRSRDGTTPIMLAADRAKVDVFELLLSHNADTTLADERGRTVLHSACFGGNKHIVESLVTRDNLNSRSQFQQTPIMFAAVNAKSDVFDLLLSHNSDISIVDDDGNTLLHLACIGGSKRIVEHLLNNDNINSTGQFERTPIMVSALNATKDVFDLLTSRNADTTVVDYYESTVLHLACLGGNVHIVERLLTDVNINCTDQFGRTPIMFAAEGANVDVFDLLLSHNADTTLVDHDGSTLLHIACLGGSKHIVELLVTDVNINNRGQFGRTLIMFAAEGANLDVFDLLLSHNADTTVVDYRGNAVLHLACLGGNKHIVESLLTNVNVNSTGELGRTPIMFAADRAKVKVFDLLLSHNADMTLVDHDGNTLLHLACSGGSKHIVELLVTGGNINSRGRFGRTPIMFAAEEANLDGFDLLLSHNADTTLVDHDGNTLLHLACCGGSKHIVELIVTDGNINSRGQGGRTPIMFAAEEANLDVFDLLLSHNADMTLVDHDENTLLHLACSGGSKHIVELLVTDGNINNRGWFGRTPIMFAAEGANVDVFDLLLSQNADTTLVDHGGDTLLHLACFGGRKHIVESLVTDVNINIRGAFGTTMIMIAAFEAKSDILDVLSLHNADTTLVDEDGNTLLHYACWGGNKHIVERVLNSDNVNSRGMFGFVPIMVAAYRGHVHILEMLCEEGADLTAVMSFGMNAVDIADLVDEKDAVKYLKSKITDNQ